MVQGESYLSNWWVCSCFSGWFCRIAITNVDSLWFLPVQFLKNPPFAIECPLKAVEKVTGSLWDKLSKITQDKIPNTLFQSQTLCLRVSLARSIKRPAEAFCPSIRQPQEVYSRKTLTDEHKTGLAAAFCTSTWSLDKWNVWWTASVKEEPSPKNQVFTAFFPDEIIKE